MIEIPKYQVFTDNEDNEASSRDEEYGDWYKVVDVDPLLHELTSRRQTSVRETQLAREHLGLIHSMQCAFTRIVGMAAGEDIFFSRKSVPAPVEVCRLIISEAEKYALGDTKERDDDD